MIWILCSHVLADWQSSIHKSILSVVFIFVMFIKINVSVYGFKKKNVVRVRVSLSLSMSAPKSNAYRINVAGKILCVVLRGVKNTINGWWGWLMLLLSFGCGCC